jgi:hypothetical protein
MIKQTVPVALLASALAFASTQVLAQRLPQERDAAASRGDSMEKRSDAARYERRQAQGVMPGPAATPEHPGGLFPEGAMDRSGSVGSSTPQRDNGAWAREDANRGHPAY